MVYDGISSMGFFQRFDRPFVNSAVLVLLVCTLFIGGAGTLAKGKLHYSNYWGGSVFAPFAVGFAAAAVVVAVISMFRRGEPPKKLRGRAARKARQADKTKF